jgi:pimeloyl-ACP methyl ester carboxylesterase
VQLAYLDSGQGAPPLVLIHGWTCDHTHFAPQAEYFGRRHRVISVDLRGHGASDKPSQDYTMAGFADDVAWLCSELRVEKPVIVGHSMGGVVALEVAARHADLPSAVVALDSPLLPAADLRARVARVIEDLKGPNYVQVARDFVSNRLFIESDDAGLKARVVESMSSAPQHVMASAMEQTFLCDTEGALAALAVPALVVSANGPAGLARIREAYPRIRVGQTVGAGHFLQLVVPDQVNAMLERFIAVAVPALAHA